jgi:hypothetical protein
MPEAERKDREERFEEEEKKFPIWIIPLVAGPVILIILIALLAGGQQPPIGSNAVVFDEEVLKKEAIDWCSEGMKLYCDARNVGSRRQKDKMYDKALKITEKAMDNLNRIRKYYDDHNIQLTGDGSCWDWEKIEQDVSKLRSDLVRDRGMTGYGSE